MDKQTERQILTNLFESGKSEKFAPHPKWYPYVLFFMAGVIITGIYYFVAGIFTEQWTYGLFLGLSYIAVAIVIYVLSYFYRRNAVLKVVKSMSEEEVGKLLQRTTFPTCKKCKKQTSKAGNYTNMFLSGISNPEEFDNYYGMMCADHSAEITQK